MILKQQKTALVCENVPIPVCGPYELLIKVRACGVCRTDLHIKDAELPSPKLPLILGHEIVGIVEDKGKNVQGFEKGQRVGVAWLASCCEHCTYCKLEQENLCDNAKYTGYQVDGGFAEYTVCRADMAIALPSGLSDSHIAPLLCAGLIGYRAYRKAAPQKTLGLYGFGAAAHILTQLAIHEGKQVYAFTRPGDEKGQNFAKKLGAVWAADAASEPPVLLDAAILFAPAGELVPVCLKNLKKAGRLITGGIYMSDIPSFPYKDLWGEKRIESVSNLTRRDAQEFFSLVAKYPIQTHVNTYPLEEADRALEDLREGKFQGAAVLLVS